MYPNSQSIRNSFVIIGVGVDLEQVPRFRRMAARRASVVSQVFSDDELAIGQTHRDPIKQLAASFALKEAMFKALGQGWLEGELFWRDIELLSPLGMRVQVRTAGPVAARLAALGVASVEASVSTDGRWVMAAVILQSPHD